MVLEFRSCCWYYGTGTRSYLEFIRWMVDGRRSNGDNDDGDKGFTVSRKKKCWYRCNRGKVVTLCCLLLLNELMQWSLSGRYVIAL